MLTLVLAEGGLRLLGRWKNINYGLYMKNLTSSSRAHGLGTVAGKYKNVSLRPNRENLVTTADFSVIYKTNSLGFRDIEYAAQPAKGVRRILAMGDSFTFGEGIPFGKRFTDIAESRLDNTEILTLGVPGYGIDQQLLQLLELGLALKPQQVVVFINRVQTKRHPTQIYRSGRIEVSENTSENTGHYLQADDPVFKKPSGWIDHSQFLSFAIYNFRMWQLRKKFAEHDRLEWGGLTSDLKNDSQPPVAESNQELIDRTKAILKKFVEICQREGIELTVVNIDVAHKLSYIGEVPGLKYVEWSENLAAAAKEHPLRFTYDWHFNEKTNAYLGELLTNLLQTPTEVQHLEP